MKTILVKGDTKLSDLKVGDLVITAEIARIVKVDRGPHGYYDKGEKTYIHVVTVRPRCETCGKKKCVHEYIKTVGWGQQEIAKVLKINRKVTK